MNSMQNKKNHFGLSILLLTAALFAMPLKAQVTIGDNTIPQPFSLLEITTKRQSGGLRLPQLTTKERDALNLAVNPGEAHGLVIYNMDIDCVEYWNGSNWISLCEVLPLTQPDPQSAVTICNGARYTFNEGPATGGSGTITYQWQSSPDGAVYTNIPGAIYQTYTTPNMSVPGDYYYRRVAASSDYGCPITSNSSKLTVNNCNSGAIVYCDADYNPNFHRNGTIIYNGTNLDVLNPKPAISVDITNTGTTSVSGTLTATGGGLTFSGPVNIAPGTTGTVTLTGSGTCTAQQGSDIPMLWSATGFGLTDNAGNTINNSTLCDFTVPVGLGQARILFLDNDNNGPQTWGPGGTGNYTTGLASIRSMAIIGALPCTTCTPPGSANFGTSPVGTVPVKFVPYNNGVIQGGGYILKANNSSDALLISNQVTSAVNNPNVPNPNVMVYATENYDSNIKGAVSSMIRGGGWIIYTTKNSFKQPDDLGYVMTDAGFPATSKETPLVNIVVQDPPAGTAAYKIVHGPFGNLVGKTITFDDGNAPLSGVATLPPNCEAILPQVNGMYVCFVCKNPATNSGIIVLGKSVGAGTSSTPTTPSAYDSTNYKPLSPNAILEMNALAYALEQSTANDIDDR